MYVSLSDRRELQLLCVLSVMEIDAMGTYNSSKAVYEECFKVRVHMKGGSLVACYVAKVCIASVGHISGNQDELISIVNLNKGVGV